MKKILEVAVFAVFVLLAACSALWSMDFGKMTNQQLFELRGAIQNAPEEDKKAYQEEWEKRISNMTDEEKKEFTLEEKENEGDDDKLNDPVVPARGYEKQLDQGQGQIIFGGFPESGGTAQ